MANSLKYAEILSKFLKKKAVIKPRIKYLKLSFVCNQESGLFLIYLLHNFFVV